MQKSNQIKADSPASTDAVITRAQFQQIAPNAAPEAVDALFASNADGQPTIRRILDEHDITEPHVIAQFLACSYLASDGFTNFNHPAYGLSILDWLSARAREWFKLGCTKLAVDWDWLAVVSMVDVTWDFEYMDWSQINGALSAVSVAMGIEDRSDEFALEDHGASEM